MLEFFSSAAFLLPTFGFLKAFFVAMFGLNLGVILTWVERRARGVIQDSIGPNRAGIPVPGFVAAGLATGPALLLVGAAVGIFLKTRGDASAHASWGMAFTQVGLFVAWAFSAVLARIVGARGAQNGVEALFVGLSPRAISATGLLLHVALFAVGLMTNGTTAESGFVQFTFSGGLFLLVGAVLASAGHVGANLAKEEVVRVTLLGLLHPAADGLKTAFKNDFEPKKGDRLLFNLAPWIAFFPALIVSGVIPFGPTLCFGKEDGAIDFGDFQGIEAVGTACREASFSLQVADLDVGILFYFAMAGTGIIGAALAGWASDNKFSLLGGMRAASQMVSYEVTMGLTVIGALMMYGTLRIDQMILWQANNAWGVFVQPLGFFLFLAAAIAETKRVPFDIPEGESEIVAGYYLEYAGMKFAMFFFSEFIAVVSSSTLLVALFLGGWHLPFFTGNGVELTLGGTTYAATLSPGLLAALGVLAFIGKIVAMCIVQVFIRWTLPRFRYDQLMALGWRILLPTSLVNILVTGALILAVTTSPALGALATAAGKVSMLVLAGGGLALTVALIVYLFLPTKKQHLIASSSARYAAAMGGVREAKLEA